MKPRTPKGIELFNPVGSLVRFSTENRQLYFPTSSTYGHFDEEIGLVISSTNNHGDIHVRVKWLKPVLQTNGNYAEVSDFNLLNFVVVSSA